ncbi:hypothetical protein LCGC14_0946360, partial [marine sediment metagenome]
MKITRYSLVLLLFLGAYCNGQTIISGQIDFNDVKNADVKIHLTKLNVDQIGNLRYLKEIAWSPVAEDGSFSFVPTMYPLKMQSITYM